eukprot:15183196-Alexandrium_andersonii.AAC.1
MEVRCASCPGDFQTIPDSDQLNLQATEDLKAEIINSRQQLQNSDSRINTPEARPMGCSPCLWAALPTQLARRPRVWAKRPLGWAGVEAGAPGLGGMAWQSGTWWQSVRADGAYQ